MWMASWKNGLSHFPPEWVKADQARFPRVVNGQGHSLEILSTLSENNRNADAKAFCSNSRNTLTNYTQSASNPLALKPQLTEYTNTQTPVPSTEATPGLCSITTGAIF